MGLKFSIKGLDQLWSTLIIITSHVSFMFHCGIAILKVSMFPPKIDYIPPIILLKLLKILHSIFFNTLLLWFL